MIGGGVVTAPDARVVVGVVVVVTVADLVEEQAETKTAAATIGIRRRRRA
ncbi:MAG: hypothetical protein ACRDRT_13155 [Pseudonocardiaceae bacterium]